ncbi:MAG: 4-hydroxy-tetrahydrodipicolinate synthase [Mesorhizobium sp.]|nr:MAG: 4-hydroxy-tetrahydrodipicolinate synthase [Mesorhizobium sp.]RWH85169.1 MAG: 4-hydroxy-tetrahydrodipicolinate synthase [Mesorhizobium sp.]RWH89924.1 MAG: 4-hydroxy-tetrahydrodipicolinate synthase [Mesorhizobium sp.]RWH98326.1 MAG: 4-hydroxy-tetrahydrodipicolinate synthase [Mesorhizobium sp.]RWI04666.1 MAG: 4-hydroxy-tetrahydrodipicolinate synthase [Mesorhizobium sp.]
MRPPILEGMWTMLATPMSTAGEINFAALGALIDHQIESGISGLLALGSTGEFYALSAMEREEVLGFVSTHVAGRVPLLAGANGGGTNEIIGHAKAAKAAGIDTVLLAPPYYSLPAQDALRRHFEEVVSRADVQVLLYDNPAQAGVDIEIDLVGQLNSDPRIVGIKEASGRIARVLAMQERFGSDLQIVSGVDDLALDLIFWGIRCWMSGPSNFLPRQMAATAKAALDGNFDNARRMMRELWPLIAEIETGKYLARIKYCCELSGLQVGDPRPPVFPISQQEAARLAPLHERASKVA